MKGLPNTDFNDRYTLSLPRLKSCGCGVDDLKPVIYTNQKHRELVDRFGLYLFREQGYDFPLTLGGSSKTGKAYFFIGGALCFTTVQPIGVVVFDKPFNNTPKDWSLEWVWIHPFERGNGVLSRAWPGFKKEFGDFYIQPPLSWGMRAFLAAQERKAAEAAVIEAAIKGFGDRGASDAEPSH